MYVLIPVVSVSSASCSDHSCGPPCRKSPPLPNAPLMLSSRRISSGRRPAAAAASSIAAFIARERVDLDVAHARQPSVGLRPGQRQHPGLVGAEPDLDVVGRRRTGVGAPDVVVRAVMANRAAVGRPRRTDHVDRLGQRVDALARCQRGAAVGGDGVPERAGAEAELDAAAAEDVEARDAAREDDRWAQRQVGDVRRDAHVGRLGRDDRQQRPGVQERGLVGVILEGDEVEAEDVGQPRELQHRPPPRPPRA